MSIQTRLKARFGLDNNSQTITNVATPVNGTDAVNKTFSINASNLTSGTIASAILANSTHYIGTTAVTLNRATGNLALTGISSIALPGATSGTITLTPAAVAGTTAISLPATSGTLVTTGDTGSVTNTMLAGSIAVSKLVSSSVTIGSTAITLGSSATTLTGLTSVTSTGFTGALTGNASTATTLQTSRNINGVAFNGSADITIADATKLPLSGGTLSGALTLSADPSTALHAATKQYVDNLAAGLSWKLSVKAATTGNITLAGGAPTVVDGVTLVANQRVLVKAQTTTSQNGIYVVTTLGTGANGTWTRATDMDSLSPLDEINSAAVFVEQGTTLADTGWTVTGSVTTLGTDAVTWTQFTGASSLTQGTGITITGNTISLVSGVATPGTYKSVTVDTYGRVTAGTNPTTLAGYGITDASPLVGSASIATVGTITSGTWNGGIISSTYGGTGVNNAGRTLTISTNSGTISFTNVSTTLTVANTASVSGTNTGDQTITLTGDVSGSGTGSFAATLATITQSTGSTFAKITLDTKGRVTGNTAVTGSDINSAYGSQTANTVLAAPNGSAGNPTFRALVAADIPSLSSTYQPLDGDLTSIAGLAGTTGFLTKTGANTWALDTNTYLTSAYTGSANIVTVGTITSGTWNAGAVTSSSVVTGTSVDTTYGRMTSGTLTTTATTQVEVPLSLSASAYRTVEYTVQVSSGVNYHSSKVVVIHNGTDTWVNEYSAIMTGTALSTFSADVSGGNIRLLVTPASATSTTFKVVAIAIEV